MASKNQILDLSPVGMIFTVLKTSDDTAGKSLDLHWELLPGCGMKDPLVHIHPNAIETYEILDGEMEFFVKDKWIPAKKGDNILVEKGIPHTFRNPSNNVVKVFNTHQPALRMQNYFEDISKILDNLTNNRTKEFKFNLKAKIHLAGMIGNYRDEIIAINPPDAAMRVLGFVANVMGVRY